MPTSACEFVSFFSIVSDDSFFFFDGARTNVLGARRRLGAIFSGIAKESFNATYTVFRSSPNDLIGRAKPGPREKRVSYPDERDGATLSAGFVESHRERLRVRRDSESRR